VVHDAGENALARSNGNRKPAGLRHACQFVTKAPRQAHDLNYILIGNISHHVNG
jgi:5-formyltetrahydrofolate cyclo-ligase